MTEPNQGITHWRQNSDEELADYICHLRQQSADTQAYLGRLELELIQRLEQRQARELQHPTLQIYLAYRTAQHDVGTLMRLAELVPQEDWAKAWHPETTKQVPVPAWLDMRVAGGWGKRFGLEVATIIKEAQLPSAPRLVIKDKPGANKQGKEKHDAKVP